MNNYLQTKWSWIEGSHGMRTQVIESLNDADLTFNPGGQNMTLGALCREMGEIEHAYIQSLQTLTQDWSYHNEEAGLESSIAQIKAWYLALDDTLKEAVTAFSDEDLQKTIERTGGFTLPVEMQLDIYLQALLIFFGKLTIYLKVMNKALPKDFQEYIG